MSRRLLWCMLVLAWIASPIGLRAQDGAMIGKGDRVRIATTDFDALCDGEVVARSSEGLSVDCWRPSSGTWELVDFRLASITGMEVYRGTKSHAGEGALIGGLIGAGFGLAAGIAASGHDCDAHHWDWDGCWWWGDEEMIPLTTITSGLLGAGVGALIGMLNRSERWEPISTDRVRGQISVAGGSVALAVSVDF